MLRRTLLVAMLMLALPASASAAESRGTWATVNICDTAARPDSMGVRASMPGNGSRQTMHMRFRAQYLRANGQWSNVGGTSSTTWKSVGSARYERREFGYIFKFDPPAAGKVFTLRGVVDFQWRQRKRRNGRVRSVVVKRAQAITAPQEENVYQADPADFSSDRCEIR